MNKHWWHNAVVYQIYPRSFCDSNGDGIGDIPGIISKLDYLADLGVDVIWLSPVYKSPMDDNGYDISDYQDIAPEFGTMADMEQLIKEAADKNIRIVMDLVVNHTSDEHPWFIEAKSSQSNDYRDYYIWRDEPLDGSLPDDQQSIFGGSAWEWDEESGQYFYHLFSKRQPDLNWENPNVHEEVFSMMNWWIDKGIGGFRLDVIDLIGKEVDKGITDNGPNLHSLLQKMNRATFGSTDLVTVGETWGATPELAKLYSSPSREELSMVFQFEHITQTWKDGDKWLPVDLDVKKLKDVLTKWQLALENEGWNSLFWNNHDLPRAVSKFGNDKEFRVESAKMLATTLHFLKGTPYVYQGEEIGMTNVEFETLDQYKDIETLNFYKVKTTAGMPHDEMMQAIYKNSRDNARTPMHWSSEKNAGFTTGTPWIGLNSNYPEINAVQALEDKNSVFYHYKKLIEYRKKLPVLTEGRFIPIYKEHDYVFAYIREMEEEKVLVVSNFGIEPQTVVLPEGLANRQVESLISNYQEISKLGSKLVLKPYESFAVRL
ncbi:alpha-glucosidase [Vibrio sp. JC009]|uniref:glycoside hydrolase family 13 protein n=1 Tax=Vibrio sp. JC009 TaxID=2912314 RepID=UPI0023AFA741|nr:alpha-glucosidase [Vibrio sp. JC009]WED23638.1 alpha-glucosidase [Vibrio sp. JC009]